MKKRDNQRRMMLAIGSLFLGVTFVSGWSVPAAADPGEPKLRVTREHPQQGSHDFRIVTVSAKNDLVTGGDVLVRIDVAAGIPLQSVNVQRNEQDVTPAFRQLPGGHSLLGLVTDLVVGDNVLAARRVGGDDEPRTEVQVTNHPISGPIISGPHEQPFFCTTKNFPIPVIGGFLGDPIDQNCSIVTRVDYVYRSSVAPNPLKPLNTSAPMPGDVMMTTTNAGKRVPFIVRMETGTINRAVYQTAILHNPYGDPGPDPFHPPAGWNGKLIYTHGGGCRAGWYFQGNGTGGVLDVFMLSQGYGVASSSLNVFGNNCNDLLASETTMMVKERFIKAYGPPRFTIGWGSSGGSYQSHQTSDNYPGLFDGIIVGHSFPDVTSATLITLFDSRLLQRYFNVTAPGLFTQEQQRQAAGFGQFGEIANLNDNAKRLDPTAEFPAVVPISARYHPIANPTGARGDVYDHTVNLYGRDEETGFARRPLDNVGVQYGLTALNNGKITKAQFLDLNSRIGGLDIDAQPIPERTAADRNATRLAYQSGRITNGGGGLAATPILDTRGYTDHVPTGDIHMRVHGFSMRARLINANGDADNHVMWVGTGALVDLDSGKPVLQDAIRQMDRWLTNLTSDSSSDPAGVKVRRAKPADLLDACFTAAGSKIVEPQTLNGPGLCNTLYPSFPTPHMSAGAPIADDIVKCALKPIDPADYAVQFSPTELQQLKQMFPQGVCDWSKPGVEQQPLKGTWLKVDVEDKHE
jgi:hypothetical protein